jgi:hypothetical protein
LSISEQPVVAAVQTSSDGSYVDWPAIFAGTALASAFSLLLLTFGSAIGLSLTSVTDGSSLSATGFAIAAGLWLVWVQVTGFFAGGYLTGRMRRRHHDATEHESDIRDGVHGLTVWGVGVLIGAVIAMSGVSAAVSTATSAVGTVAQGAMVAGAAATDDGADPTGLVVDRFLRSTGAPTSAATPAPAEGGGASSNPQSDPRPEVIRVIGASLAAGELDAGDRAFLAQLVSQRSGVDQQEAEKRVDAMWAQTQATAAEAKEAAEQARRLAVIAAFATAASLLIAAAAGYFGAALGGNHRDKQTVFENWSRPW